MKFKPGMSVATLEEFAALPLTPPEKLACLEFPGEVLDAPELCSRVAAWAAAGVEPVVRSLVAPGLTDAVAAESLALRMEFDRRLRRRCEAAERCGVKLAGLDWHAGWAAESDGLRLLRGMFGLLEQCDLTLVLNWRPSGGAGEVAAAASGLADLRRRLMYPRLAFGLDGVPETPGGEPEDGAGLEVLRFDLAIVRWHGSGNWPDPGRLGALPWLRRCRTPEGVRLLAAGVDLEPEALDRLAAGVQSWCDN